MNLNAGAQRVCIYAGLVMVTLFIGGFVVSGFLIPPSPREGAEEVARFFAENTTRIHVGMALCMFGSALLVPWSVAIFMITRRGTGPGSPAPWVQLLSGTLFSLEFLYLIMFWQVAAFRAGGDTPALVIRTINDMAWLPFVGLTSTAVLQAVGVGASVLSDRRTTPLFPRWSGYASLWAALIFTSGTLCVFFDSGPFAWNGLLSWYVPLGVYVLWMPTVSVLALRSIRRLAVEDGPGGSASAGAQQDTASIALEMALMRAELDKVTAALAAKP